MNAAPKGWVCRVCLYSLPPSGSPSFFGCPITNPADVVYLDAKTDTYLEEVSSCNIFVRKGKTIKTPPLGGTILPGDYEWNIMTWPWK